MYRLLIRLCGFRNDLDSFEDSDKQLHVDLAETKCIHCTDRRQYKNGEQLSYVPSPLL